MFSLFAVLSLPTADAGSVVRPDPLVATAKGPDMTAGPWSSRRLSICNADRVVRAQVVAVGPARLTGEKIDVGYKTDEIVTPIRFAVDFELEGSGPMEIELLSPGGRVDSVRYEIPGSSYRPLTELGSRWLLAVAERKHGLPEKHQRLVKVGQLPDAGLPEDQLAFEVALLRDSCTCAPDAHPRWPFQGW